MNINVLKNISKDIIFCILSKILPAQYDNIKLILALDARQLQNYHGFLKVLEDSMDIHRIFLRTMVFQEAINRPPCSHSSRIIDALSSDNYFESRKSFSRPRSSMRIELLLFEKGANCTESMNLAHSSPLSFHSTTRRVNRHHKHRFSLMKKLEG